VRLSRLVARLEHEGLVTRSMCDVRPPRNLRVPVSAGRERYELALPTYRAVLSESLAAAPAAGLDDSVDRTGRWPSDTASLAATSLGRVGRQPLSGSTQLRPAKREKSLS